MEDELLEEKFNKASEMIQNADSILILAGAGMGVVRMLRWCP
jgi:hypothetical protein